MRKNLWSHWHKSWNNTRSHTALKFAKGFNKTFEGRNREVIVIVISYRESDFKHFELNSVQISSKIFSVMTPWGAYWSVSQLHIDEGRGRPRTSRLALCKFLWASVASLGVPWQRFEGVLASPPATGTPSKFCLHLHLEPKPSVSSPTGCFCPDFPPSNQAQQTPDYQEARWLRNKEGGGTRMEDSRSVVG